MNTDLLPAPARAGVRGSRGGHRRRAGLAAGAVLMVAGLLALGWPWLTARYTQHAQAALRGTPLDVDPVPGDAWGVLRIPAISLDAVVVEGVTQEHLRSGPGHYPETARPPTGLVAIAAHRTTWGAAFRHLDRLRAGDEVEVTVAEGRFVYRVAGDPFVIAPDDRSVLHGDAGTLVLTSCHPPGSARQRIVVRAELVSDGEPR